MIKTAEAKARELLSNLSLDEIESIVLFYISVIQ